MSHHGRKDQTTTLALITHPEKGRALLKLWGPSRVNCVKTLVSPVFSAFGRNAIRNITSSKTGMWATYVGLTTVTVAMETNRVPHGVHRPRPHTLADGCAQSRLTAFQRFRNIASSSAAACRMSL